MSQIDIIHISAQRLMTACRGLRETLSDIPDPKPHHRLNLVKWRLRELDRRVDAITDARHKLRAELLGIENPTDLT